ncbi:MAG TPA: MFS transporter, partial [Gemmatimonadaceae bacterium]|nr:MFS transporter [Gemmatimonadaceae bacterium]
TMQEETEPATGRASRREWIGLAVIALPCLLYSMDLTVLHLAVPALTADLQPTSAQLLWIIDIYGFLVAGSLITAGTLGDRIGRRRLLMIGAALFGIASILAAFSTTAEMLIATRALLGIAGATVAPSTLSLIRNMFHDPHQRTVAISVWIMSYSIGGAIAPLVGGVLLELYWWGSVFLIAVPVMALLLVIGPRLLPEYRDPDAGRLDLVSAALSLGAVLAMIFGLKEIAQDGPSVAALLVILAGVMIGVVFVRRQLTLQDPLVDLRLFRVPGFSASLATYGLTILVLFGGFLFLPQYLQLVLGLSPLTAGLWTLPWALAFILGSIVTPQVARRTRPAILMTVGLVVSAIGYWMTTGFDVHTHFAAFAAATFVFSLGVAPVVTLTTDLILGSAPPERAGAASALSETSAEFGGALGIAIFGSVGVAIYRVLVGDVVPAGVPGDAAESARATLAGAVALAQQLPGRDGAPLADAARQAFVRGLQLCAAISALVSVGLAVFVATALRHIRPASERDALQPQPR